MTRTVRTRMRPDQPIEVGDAEYVDLDRQGLLLPDPQPPARVVPEPAAPAATKTRPDVTADRRK
jgi:hypothetical protein